MLSCEARFIVGVLNDGVIPAPSSSFAIARSRAARIPILALTANAMSGDRERCLEAGMDAYVAKPVRTEALLDLIEKLLPLDQPVA